MSDVVDSISDYSGALYPKQLFSGSVPRDMLLVYAAVEGKFGSNAVWEHNTFLNLSSSCKDLFQ